MREDITIPILLMGRSDLFKVTHLVVFRVKTQRQ